jgi:hypothetical protein
MLLVWAVGVIIYFSSGIYYTTRREHDEWLVGSLCSAETSEQFVDHGDVARLLNFGSFLLLHALLAFLFSKGGTSGMGWEHR